MPHSISSSTDNSAKLQNLRPMIDSRLACWFFRTNEFQNVKNSPLLPPSSLTLADYPCPSDAIALYYICIISVLYLSTPMRLPTFPLLIFLCAITPSLRAPAYLSIVWRLACFFFFCPFDRLFCARFVWS